MNAADSSNQSPARTRRTWKLAIRLLVVLVGLFVTIVFIFVCFESARDISESENFRPGSVMQQVLSTNSIHLNNMPTTGTSPLSIVSPTTSSTAIEIIPESQLARPEERAQARQINQNFRDWVELVKLSKENPQEFHRRREGGKNLDYTYPVGTMKHFLIQRELSKFPGLYADYHKKLSDACLQLLIYYKDWDAASTICWGDPELYSWDEILYCLQRERRAWVKYPRMVVWRGARIYWGLTDARPHDEHIKDAALRAK